ncbi:EI24 domain-containing protein [Streptacidiphilus monticola]|uniref:EI24 domain-containing protein n=1 Tax=Streptacidiphilus monticola TaxID=2161674 RepID=A0ABW1GC34_9ACTN
MRDLGTGFAHLLKGQRWVVRHPRWWAFGLLPGLVALVLYLGAVVSLVAWSGDLARWATPFADGWNADGRGTLRVVVAVLLVCGGLLLAVVTFTAVTLVLGQPFYESLAERVERMEGGAPDAPRRSPAQQFGSAIRDGLASVLLAAGFGVLLFVAGFLPLVGQTVVPAIGVCVSGFFLTEQLAGVALDRRGLTFRQRVRLLRARLWLALGFGAPLALLFLVPFVAVVAMPGGVAGGTLLARELVPPAAPQGPGEQGPGQRGPGQRGQDDSDEPQGSPSAVTSSGE